MPTGESARAAAKRVGCTHTAINGAVAAGRIPKLADGTLAPEMVDAWHRGRRAPRGGAHRKDATAPSTFHSIEVAGSHPRQPGSTPQFVARTALDPDGIPPEAYAVAALVESGADDLAGLLCRHLPLGVAQVTLAEWVAATLASFVGAPGATAEPYCAAAEPAWPAPPTGGPWWRHPLFRPPVTDWAGAQAAATAWRAQRGLPPL